MKKRCVFITITGNYVIVTGGMLINFIPERNNNNIFKNAYFRIQSDFGFFFEGLI